MTLQKNYLEEIYRKHHQKGDRYGYLFCHGHRGPYLKNWIGEGKKVLDLGCRDGMLTQSYASGNEVIGVDVDKEALRLTQELLKIETLWLDLNYEWPFLPNSFDVIVACEILEHIFMLDHFLQKIWQTLKPGGLFIGSVPNAFRMRNRFKFLRGEEIENDPTHVRQFSYLKLETTLSHYFSSVEIIPIRGKVAPFLSVSPKIPSRITRLFSQDFLWRGEKK
jgi:2-polyprenyl-3-methyl-5-hydroxy-6-metoxy-1,4-benzoquinol methylase